MKIEQSNKKNTSWSAFNHVLQNKWSILDENNRNNKIVKSRKIMKILFRKDNKKKDLSAEKIYPWKDTIVVQVVLFQKCVITSNDLLDVWIRPCNEARTPISPWHKYPRKRHPLVYGPFPTYWTWSMAYHLPAKRSSDSFWRCYWGSSRAFHQERHVHSRR